MIHEEGVKATELPLSLKHGGLVTRYVDIGVLAQVQPRAANKTPTLRSKLVKSILKNQSNLLPLTQRTPRGYRTAQLAVV